MHFKCYPFSSFPSRNSLSHPSSPCLVRVFLPTTTHSSLNTQILNCGNKPSQDQGHILPLMSYKAILCFICNWRRGSLHCLVLYSVGVQGFLVGWYCCSSYGVATPFSSFSPFSKSFIRVPMLNTRQGLSMSIHVCFSGSGRVSQETAVSGSCQQAFLSIHNSVWVWWLHMK